jgi:hypothetical protein
MIESIFIILLVIALLFLVLTIVWESLAIGALDIILWLVLAISVYQLELPYTAIQSDNTIVTGVHTIETLYPLSWVFLLLAFITMFYLFFNIIFPMLKGRFSKVM